MQSLEVRGWHTLERRMMGADELEAYGIVLLARGVFATFEYREQTPEKELGKIGGIKQYSKRVIEQTQIIPNRFTGMCTPDGKKIFEGDIVQRYCLDTNCQESHIGIVEFSVQWLMWMIKEKGTSIRDMSGYYPPLAFGNPGDGIILPIYVLGDKFTNPKLLV